MIGGESEVSCGCGSITVSINSSKGVVTEEDTGEDTGSSPLMENIVEFETEVAVSELSKFTADSCSTRFDWSCNEPIFSSSIKEI